MTNHTAIPSAGHTSTPAEPNDHTSTPGASDGRTSTPNVSDGRTSTAGASDGRTSTAGAPDRHPSTKYSVVRLLPRRRRRRAAPVADPRARRLHVVAPNEPVGHPSPIRLYRPPLLVELDNAADLLEVLGPAQANYGGTGFV